MTAKLLSTKSLTAAYIGSDFSLSGADFDLNDKEILLTNNLAQRQKKKLRSKSSKWLMLLVIYF